MTTERTDDRTPRTDGDRERGTGVGDRRNGQQPKKEEPNPLLREGPDAPDAADIEEPEQQL